MANNIDLIVAMAEAEQALVDGVNEVIARWGLPCYLLEPMVEKIHRQLLAGKAQELADAKNLQMKEGDHENNP